MNSSLKQFAVVATVVGISLTALQLPSNSVLRGQSQDIPVNEFTAQQVADGVVLPADAHNFFTCSTAGIGIRIHNFIDARFWIYEFTGNEPPFNGEFFISDGELALNPQYGSLDTLESFIGGRRYYVMSAKDMYFKCNEGISLNAYCGDSIVSENEECDDGNNLDNDGCNATCQIERCGDGVVSGNEDCDDGNQVGGDGCSAECDREVCGDGIITPNEKCDDANGLNRDGCNACQKELGYSCSGEPSECYMLIPTLGGAGTSSSAGFSTSTSLSLFSHTSIPSTPSSYGHLSSFGMSSSLVRSSTHSTNSNDARHTECQNNQCVDVVGVGTNECETNNQCVGNVGAAAFVTQKEIGTGDIAVENQKNINLLRFEIWAQTESLLFTQAIFEAQEGSANNATNYALWVDTNADHVVDTIVQDGVSAQAGQVKFDNLAGGGIVIPKSTTGTYEVHADVAGSLTSNILQLAFEDGLFSNTIAMESVSNGTDLYGIERDGQCTESHCDIVLRTTDSQPWTLVSQGDLFVTKDTQPLRNRQLLGGTLGEAVLRLEFHAENEDIDVTDLQISAPPLSRSIDRFELFRDGESTKFADATKGGCGSDATAYPDNTFCANMENLQLVVPKGEDIDVIIRPRMRTDLVGGISGDAFNTHLNGSVATNLPGAVRARGAESSNDLSQNDGDTIAEGEIFIGADSAGPTQSITGEDETVVMAKITSITNANPDGNGTAVPTGISSIGQFKFSAAAHSNSKDGENDAILDSIIFNVNATNVAINAQSFKVFNKADQTKTVNCQPYYLSGDVFTAANISGTFFVQCTGIDASVVDSEIDEGTDSTFVLEANILNPNVAATSGGVSVLQVALQKFDQRGNFGMGSDDTHIQWIDRDGSTNVIFNWIEYPETSVKSTSYNS